MSQLLITLWANNGEGDLNKFATDDIVACMKKKHIRFVFKDYINIGLTPSGRRQAQREWEKQKQGI